MRKIYSLNQFYLTFRHDNFWYFDETLNAIKNNKLYTFIQIYDFLFFGWLYLVFFSKSWETFLCQRWMMYNMYNNNDSNNNNECQKFPEETFWGQFQFFKYKQFLKINLLLWKKLYCIQMAQKWHLWQELLQSTSKIWKPSYDWMTW